MRTVIDIESRSAADLRKVGTFTYAEDPTTSITLVGYTTGDGAAVWRPSQSPIPRDLADALADERVALVAHNFQFERAVMSGPAGRAIGIPSAVGCLDRWDCTAARAAHVGLPRDLAGAANALRLKVQKDKAGHALMLRVSKPRTLNPLTWWDDEVRMSRLAEYCRQDVEVETELDRVLPALSAAERQVWLATERLNDRGVLIDQLLLNRLVEIAAAARIDNDRQMAVLTGGCVPKVSNHGALTRWLISKGADVEGCSKDIVQGLLDSELDPTVQAVLELRQDGGGSSSQKTAAIQRQLSANGRIHGALIYGGAPSTLRWCLAESTRVLTKNTVGEIQEKPIEIVSIGDFVWDGDGWVSHEGVVYSGEKEVIEYDNITATPEHHVFVSDTEWVTLREASVTNTPIFKGNGDPWHT